MSGPRSSRADRRRRDDPTRMPRIDRRSNTPITQVLMRSQVTSGEVQIFVGSPLTADNCASGRTAFLQHSSRSQRPVIVVDLEKCAYMDTPGLSLLFDLRKHADQSGKTFFLQNPSRAVQRILNITAMHRIFRIRQTSVDLERIPSAKPISPQDKDTILLPKP